MSRIAELTCFAGVALAIHLGFWAGFARTGSEAAGAQGETLISLEGASGDISALVEAWEQPVEAAQTMQPLTPPPPDQVEASPPDIDRSPEVSINEQASPPDQTAATDPAPEREAALAPPAPEAPPPPPQADTQSLRPPVMQAAPDTSLRPRERPNPPVVRQPQPAERPAQSAPRAAPQNAAPQTAPRPTRQSAAPQTAAGRNGGTNAGRATQERSATLSPAARQSLMGRWGASLRAQVERRKAYPRGSSASGTTVLRIAVTAGGSLAGVSVARSSGARELDQAAIQAVRRARFPAAPKELGAGTFQFNLPLAFARR